MVFAAVVHGISRLKIEAPKFLRGRRHNGADGPPISRLNFEPRNFPRQRLRDGVDVGRRLKIVPSEPFNGLKIEAIGKLDPSTPFFFDPRAAVAAFAGSGGDEIQAGGAAAVSAGLEVENGTGAAART